MMFLSNAKVSGPKPHSELFVALDPIPQEGKKQVFVINNVRDKFEEDLWEVTEFNVTYDDKGILSIRDLADQNIVAIFYGPGTWKYIECLQEKFENGQEEENS